MRVSIALAHLIDRMLDSGLSGEAANRVLLSQAALAHPGMPIQDAIDLVQYLADVTAGYMRFKPGLPTVAPPIDIAVITPFQGIQVGTQEAVLSSRAEPRRAPTPAHSLSSREADMSHADGPKPERIHPFLIQTRRPEIPPPQKLTPEEIEMVEKWLRENVTLPTHGPFSR